MDLKGTHIPLWKRGLLACAAFSLATALWLPALHWFCRPAPTNLHATSGISPLARDLAASQLALWEDPLRRQGEIAKMRAANAEWDFMGRTYLVLALAEMATREPAQQARYLAVIDQILDETLRLEQTRGMYFFLMEYARASQFVSQPPRSLFVDGEIALMLAVRQAVSRDSRYAPLLAERIDLIAASMSRGPVLCAESYPDECWMFCNSLAVAAVKISDRLDGRDHRPLIDSWLKSVKENLVDPTSGMLVSSFNYRGTPMDGPEGSSIWMVAHCLRLVDPEFARRQYQLARTQLGRQILGFGFAREWPAGWKGPQDIDSGPIVPGVDASAGSSGLAILGASSFGDDAYLRTLLASLNLAAFPVREGNALRYAASNQVGDAVMLYALVQGPLWSRFEEARP